MKRSMLCLLVVLFSLNSFCQVSKKNETKTEPILGEPKIDQRVELLSIVFRLAGVPEYNQYNFKKYTDAIHAHFEKYKNHPCVLFAKKMSDSNGVGFNAPMDLALRVSQAPEFEPIVEFTDQVPEYRWGKKNAEDFIQLLKSFYTDARCQEFFTANASLYNTVQERFKVVYDSLDTRWYEEFYGIPPSGKLIIIIGIGNGGCNYGSKVVYPGGREDAYAVMGTWTVDEEGIPVYSNAYYLSTLIHEFNHSFINHLNERNLAILEPQGKIVFQPVGDLMNEQAYPTPLHMMNEALVRAAVVRYIAKHNPGTSKTEGEIRAQLGNGFIWIDELAAKLEYYENNRDKYPTLESFMPAIVDFYSHTAQNIDKLLSKCAQVKASVGIDNHAAGISPKTSEMKLIFDKPVSCENKLAIFNDPEQKRTFPIQKEGTGFSADKTILTLGLKLKPNSSYYFRLPGLQYHTEDGYPLLDYIFEFSTK